MLVSHRLNGLYFAGLYRNCIQFLPTEALAPQLEYACCQHGMRAYFIKASELRDRFTTARRTGKTDSCLKSLVRPSCLIIDEIGHCEFDKENTRLFFDLIDRRYGKTPSRQAYTLLVN